jgi:tRNA A-37 threonylcarbamoyl transferase component Bud32
VRPPEADQDPRDVREIVATGRYFKRLAPDLIDAMLGRMREIEYASGETVIRQNDPGDSLQVILEGAARVFVTDEAGAEHEIGKAKRGDVLGEMTLVTGGRRTANVVAITPVRILTLPAEHFHELARMHPQLGVVLSHLIADRLGRGAHDMLGDKVVEGYRIVRSIGQGGMAVVYEAVQIESGKHVALKMMSHRLMYDPAAATRFREEAEIGATLEHPNIVQLLARFSAYGTHFLVMELCRGPGLNEVLKRNTPVPEELARPILGQLALALRYVHSRNLIHRDVKGSNVRLTFEGEAKLMDFGLAKPTLNLDGRTETHELALVGTPSYMAPEQFDADRLDHRVDIYALACLGYKLLSARRPFEGCSLAGMIRQKIKFAVPPRDQIGNGISEEMHAFVEGGMRPEREERLASLDACVTWAAPIDVAAIESVGRK